MSEKKQQGIVLSKGKLIACILVAFLLVGSGVTLGMNWQTWFGEETVQPDLDEGAVDWQGTQTNKKPETEDGQKGIALPGYKSISLKANQKEQSVNLYNPEVNDCYFVMSLILPDGTQIWQSKMVAPGKGLYQITLNQEIAAGTYENSILKYDCYKQNDELTKLNGGEVRISLEVK